MTVVLLFVLVFWSLNNSVDYCIFYLHASQFPTVCGKQTLIFCARIRDFLPILNIYIYSASFIEMILPFLDVAKREAYLSQR